MAVNGLHLRNASVKEVANAIQQANPNRCGLANIMVYVCTVIYGGYFNLGKSR